MLVKREDTDMEKTMEKIVALAKNRGFVYPGSEIDYENSRKINR